MSRLVTAKEMKDLDSNTINKMGVPSMVLMERAALSVVEEIDPDVKNVLCVCGTGNNGGDGFAIARLLFLKDIDVDILFIGKPEKCSLETNQQMKIAKNYGVNMLTEFPKDTKYQLIIDALFGIGLSRSLEGIYKDIIDLMNKSKDDSNSELLSVDIPSGLSADTGKVLGTSVIADKTVTFAFNKLGMTLNDGPSCSGKIVVKDIGIYSD